MLKALLLTLEWAILLMLECVCMCYVYVCLEIVEKTTLHTRQILLAVFGDCHKNFPVSRYLYDQSSLHVHIFMIMASTGKQKLESVLIQKTEWICPNIGFIVHDQPIMMINGREHYLINWNYQGYKDEY